jgi:hypothetical protein
VLLTRSSLFAAECDIDVYSDEMLADPYPAFRELHDAGPAVRLRSVPVWAVAALKAST